MQQQWHKEKNIIKIEDQSKEDWERLGLAQIQESSGEKLLEMFWRGSGEVPERFLYKREYNSFLDHSTEFLRKWTLGTDTVIIAKYISTCECNRISFEASLKWICWVGLVQSAKKSWFGVKGVVFLPQTLKVIFTLPPYTSSTHFFTTPSHPTHAHMMHFMNP